MDAVVKRGESVAALEAVARVGEQLAFEIALSPSSSTCTTSAFLRNGIRKIVDGKRARPHVVRLTEVRH